MRILPDCAKCSLIWGWNAYVINTLRFFTDIVALVDIINKAASRDATVVMFEF